VVRLRRPERNAARAGGRRGGSAARSRARGAAAARSARTHRLSARPLDRLRPRHRRHGGCAGGSLRVPLHAWPRTARKLAMEVEGTNRTVVLLTSLGAARSLPLPVAQRLEVTRPALDRLVVRVAKDRHGRISQPRSVAWTRAEPFQRVEEWSARVG